MILPKNDSRCPGGLAKRVRHFLWGALLLIALGGTAFSQTAEDYYHHGANFYIDAVLQEAIAAVEKGLQMEPDNPKLQALLEKLKEQQQRQQQQQNSQQPQQNQDQQEQQQQPQQPDQNQEEQQEDQQQPQPDDQNQLEPPEAQQQPQPQEMTPKEISKEDAERILQALLSKEKENKELLRPKVAKKKKVSKDW